MTDVFAGHNWWNYAKQMDLKEIDRIILIFESERDKKIFGPKGRPPVVMLE